MLKTVSTDDFVQRMRDHWTSNLQNHTNPDLEQCWRIMADTFNAKISKNDKKWHVLQPATGSGKTQGLIVYCSMLAEVNDTFGVKTGALIVVRLKSQADDIVKQINAKVGRNVALAKHTDTRVTSDEINAAEVLVITHKAYQLAIDPAHAASQSSWPTYSDWLYGQRRLVVIDEAIDVVDHHQVTADDIRQALGAIPFNTALKHHEEVRQLQSLVDHIEAVLTAKGDLKETKLLWRDGAFNEEIDMSELRKDLKSIQWDHHLEKREDTTYRRNKKNNIDKVIKAAEAILQRFAYYHLKVADHTLNTAHLIIPEDLTGPVVLDATASSNLVWELFGDRAVVPSVPRNARRYDNVTVYISRDYTGVGKGKMREFAHDRAGVIVSDLNARLGEDNKALLVCHKAVEHTFMSYLDSASFEVSTAHFGALDGRNDWQECDTVVIAGLPYKDRTWSINSFLALRDLPADGWFDPKAARPFNQHKDIIKATQSHRICVDVIQAVNRVRCRRVVDADGNCEPTSVYITLPDGYVGQDVMEALRREMPGIKLKDWFIEKDWS